MDANLAVLFLINSYFGFPLFFRQTKNWNLCLWIIRLMYGRVGCLMALPYKNAGLQIANFAWWVLVLIFNADLYWSDSWKLDSKIYTIMLDANTLLYGKWWRNVMQWGIMNYTCFFHLGVVVILDVKLLTIWCLNGYTNESNNGKWI